MDTFAAGRCRLDKLEQIYRAPQVFRIEVTVHKSTGYQIAGVALHSLTSGKDSCYQGPIFRDDQLFLDEAMSIIANFQ